MSACVTFKGENGEIVLDILNYENPGALNLEDCNWLRGTLRAQAGPFSGAIELGITTKELAELHSRLAASVLTMGDEIHFATMEGDWEFNLSFERSGAAVVYGFLRSRRAEGNALQYELRTDPISLERAVQDLLRITELYSVKRVLT
jgi:hypothetical protein